MSASGGRGALMHPTPDPQSNAENPDTAAKISESILRIYRHSKYNTKNNANINIIELDSYLSET